MEGGSGGKGSSATSAGGGGGGGGGRKSGPVPAATGAETAPRPHLPGNSPPPSPAHSCPSRSRSPAAPASPRPAARPRGRPSARGPRPGVVVRPRPLPRRPPGVAATTGGRRRRGGGGGGGVLLSRPLPSPELAPHVRARWSEAGTKVVLPRCAARAESAAEAAPPPPGALGGLRTPPQVSARRIWCVCGGGRDGEQDRELGRRGSRSPRAGGRRTPDRDPDPEDPSPDPDYRGASRGRPWCSVSLRRSSRFRRRRWPGSDPGGGRTRAALCGGP